LARFILDLAADSSKTSDGGHADRVALTLTHDEIAQMLGSSRETVTRLFADFRRKHLIEVHGSTLLITNKAGLEKTFEP
jgi:CRP/FNR family cyclic AMP-dependent transcriptional regulator